MENTLLLVVDVQNGFVNDSTRHVLEPINALIRQWRENDKTIVFSRFINPENGLWERLRDWHECKTGPATLLHQDLLTDGAAVRDKQTYTAWGPDLAELCRDRLLDTAVLCGIDTNECVLATAMDIFDAGIRPIVAVDCCASGAGDRFHQAGILLLERALGAHQMLSSQAILSEARS